MNFRSVTVNSIQKIHKQGESIGAQDFESSIAEHPQRSRFEFRDKKHLTMMDLEILRQN